VHDAADADARIRCPLQVLWGAKSVVGRVADPLAVWRGKASDVRGGALPGGHFLAEEVPQDMLAALSSFLEA
jgi:haloacetate dehalogenase